MSAQPASVVSTHIFGATLLPAHLMPRFYARLGRRLAGPDAIVALHSMPGGGLGRTDAIVDHFRPILEDAQRRGIRLRLAGHSLGGLVVWALTQEYPDAVEVAELWAAPIRGTSRAGLRHPVAEARFLAPGSRFLARYDRPVDGPLVRSIYTTTDLLATPALEACFVEGATVENHVVTPTPLPDGHVRTNLVQHQGSAGHVQLPRYRLIQRALARLDQDRPAA